MAFIPLKGKGAASVSKGSATVGRKCLLYPCVVKSAAVLWSWPLAWAESASSFVGHRKGRPSPFANRHEQGAHFPAWLCRCWRQMGQEILQLTLYCWDLLGFSPTSCLCPEKCENLISWLFPSWLPALGGESQYHCPAVRLALIWSLIANIKSMK